MITAKHIPGPWHADIASNGEWACIKRLTPTHDGGVFCRIDSLHWTNEARETLEANARLIAAAPDFKESSMALYDAMQRLLAFMGDVEVGVELAFHLVGARNKHLAAMAKAAGRDIEQGGAA